MDEYYDVFFDYDDDNELSLDAFEYPVCLNCSETKDVTIFSDGFQLCKECIEEE